MRIEAGVRCFSASRFKKVTEPWLVFSHNGALVKENNLIRKGFAPAEARWSGTDFGVANDFTLHHLTGRPAPGVSCLPGSLHVRHPIISAPV